MDNFLTPNKIERLIHLAEDRSNTGRHLLLTEEDLNQFNAAKNSITYESSSGILDLDRVEGFGDSHKDSMSLGPSTFNAGEMTGRSTGADNLGLPSRLEEFGRHSLSLESLTSVTNKQTHEVHNVMRHSIATNSSFRTRDLTADEASFVAGGSRLSGQHTFVNITDDPNSIATDMSLGGYFHNRMPECTKLFTKMESPNRSMMPSITEVTPNEVSALLKGNAYVDDTLDSIPVRQPRGNSTQIITDGSSDTKKYDRLFKKPQNYAPIDKAMESASSKIPVKSTNMIPGPVGHKSFMTSAKPADLLLKNMHASFRPATDDTEGDENSFSISKIADYLGKESNVSITGMLQLQKKRSPKKQPLAERYTNTRGQDTPVTYLSDTRKAETASSTGTISTVISVGDLRTSKVMVTQHNFKHSDDVDINIDDSIMINRVTRSKSPSSKSQTTATTVRDNFTSFKSSSSPVNSSRGETNTNISKAPSPEVEYSELDNSVDWREVLQQKRVRQQSAASELAAIEAAPVQGYVGVSCAATVKVTTLSDTWLTATFQFDKLPNDGQDLNIELPRLPLLLAPRKCEQFKLHITSNVEMQTSLPFTILMKDSSVDGDIPQKGNLNVHFKLPVIQAMTAGDMNKVTFPPVLENKSCTMHFVLISDCPDDLQLELCIERDSLFNISNVQEIKKVDVNKVIMERPVEDRTGKVKSKIKNKQLCRLTCGNAIKVAVVFNAPKLSESQLSEKEFTFNGVFNVNLIGVSAVLRKVDLVGAVGFANLALNVPDFKLHLTSEPTKITATNTGTAAGLWKIRSHESSLPFNVYPVKFELQPDCTQTITFSYTGAEDCFTEMTLALDEVTTDKRTLLGLSGGTSKPLKFPIKTNHNVLSWVRAGRREISLLNCMDKKIHIRCQIIGEGFCMDLPGVESRGSYCLPFAPNERRQLPISFTPTSHTPCTAKLVLAFDKNSDFSRKVPLYGCASGDSARWSGLATYGDTALVRAVGRAPLALRLYNRAATPAFVCATLQYNLHYTSVAATSRLLGARSVVAARAHHSLTLRLDWPRVEARARLSASTALASLSVLTGTELTRRRIMRILKDESTGELNTSLLPDNLKVLTDHFEGEEASMDNLLKDFEETEESLDELISGLHELTAQIDLPQDFGDENNTIIIADDTIINHHTLCE